MWLQFNFPTVFPSMSSLFTYRTVLVSQIGVLPRKLLFALQDPVSASPPLRPDKRRAGVLQRAVPQHPAWGEEQNSAKLSSLAPPGTVDSPLHSSAFLQMPPPPVSQRVPRRCHLSAPVCSSHVPHGLCLCLVYCMGAGRQVPTIAVSVL